MNYILPPPSAAGVIEHSLSEKSYKINTEKFLLKPQTTLLLKTL